MSLSPKEICLGYFRQIWEGCDRFTCDNVFCRTCSEFKLKLATREDALRKSVKLLQKHPFRDVLCRGIAKSTMDRGLCRKAAAFDALIADLKARGPEYKLEDDKRSDCYDMIEEVTNDVELFKCLLKSNKRPLSTENFALSDELLTDFVDVVHWHFSLFDSMAYHFERITDAVLREEMSLHTIRALVICWSFDRYLVTGNLNKMFFRMVTRLMEIDELVNHWVYAMSKLPKFLAHTLAIAQSNLSMITMEFVPGGENRTDWWRHADQTAEGVRGLFPRTCARMVNYVWLAADLGDVDIPVECFVNEPLSALLAPSHEPIEKLNTYHDGYVTYPAALSVTYKLAVMRVFRELRRQDSVARLVPRPESVALEDYMRVLTREVRNFRFDIRVSRNDIVNDALQQLSGDIPDYFLFQKLKVQFTGEQGVDVGGLSREFYFLLCNEIFSPEYGMFVKIPGDKYWFRAGPHEMPGKFTLFGIIVAMAMLNEIVLPIKFPTILYRKLRGAKGTHGDLVELDEELARGFADLRKLKADGGNIEDCCLTFAVTVGNFGSMETVMLKENGDDIPVTNDTLEEYIDLYTDFLFNRSVEGPFECFARGYLRICDHAVFRMLTVRELDLLISGIEVVDWSLLKAATEYGGGYEEDSRAVIWFWEIFDELSESDRIRFLRFATGSDRAPVGGLEAVNLIIKKVTRLDMLPVAHTCFSTFKLPDYETKDEMRRCILIAVEHAEGFGLV